MKKIRAWFRKNKRAFLITDFLLLITTIGILVATANPADVQCSGQYVLYCCHLLGCREKRKGLPCLSVKERRKV